MTEEAGGGQKGLELTRARGLRRRAVALPGPTACLKRPVMKDEGAVSQKGMLTSWLAAKCLLNES
jgi:hypothetical protein